MEVAIGKPAAREAVAARGSVRAAERTH